MAAVRALTAPLRAVRSARIDSTIPSRRLGAAVATPANTARAAASASDWVRLATLVSDATIGPGRLHYGHTLA